MQSLPTACYDRRRSFQLLWSTVLYRQHPATYYMIPNVRQASREVAVQLHRRTRTCMLGGTGGVFAFRAFPLLLLCCLPCSHTRQWRDLLGSSILTLTSSFAIAWESRYVSRHTVLVVASFSVRQKPNTSDHGNCHRQETVCLDHVFCSLVCVDCPRADADLPLYLTGAS